MSQSRRTRRRLARGTAAAAVAALAGALLGAPAHAGIVPEPIAYPASAPLTLTPVGSYETGVFDASAAEIVTYHAGTQRLFVVNAQAGLVEVLDVSDPAAPAKLFEIAADGVANSVAVRADGLGVIAFEAVPKTAPGSLVFFDATASAPSVLGSVQVGALPDMVALSADGSYAVVANEGEPADDFSVDPEGSIGVVRLPSALAAPSQSDVRTADFHAFEAGGAKTLPEDVRVFGPAPHGDELPVSRNLEPEYIAIDGGTAYAALQEANAVAVVDLASATVTDIWPLGFKDHGAPGQGIDPSDRDGGFDIRTFEGLKGVYMPDGLNAYQAGGQTYLVTANEGDAREWGDYVEPSRVKDLGKGGLAPVCADSPLAALTGDADLGRLNVTTADGLDAAGECYEELYSFGSRSFSIWTTDGTQVFDSGDEFERITHAANPEFFNSNHTESNLEGRSDDKGPEPENLAIGQVGDKTYAFIGFERVGGVAVYDITVPAAAEFVSYVNNRNFAESVEAGGSLAAAGDLGAEGLAFTPAADAPGGVPLLAVGNEVSGTTTLFEVSGEGVVPPAETITIDVLGINDFHGRIQAEAPSAGAAVLAGAVAQLRGENPNTLFVSAGDNIGASTFASFSQEDNPTIDALGAAGLDLSVVGNHEFDRGFADLTDRVIPRFAAATGADGADFALGANVYRKGTKTPALREYALREVDGVTVGFIGTVTEQTAAMVSPTGIADIEFGDQLEAADRVAAQLRDGDPANGEADVVVLLTHEGSAGTDCAAIATEDTLYGELVREASPAIDAILSGHTHQSYACEYDVEGWAGLKRPVLQAHQYGTTLGKVSIEVDPETKRVLSLGSELLPLVGTDGAALYPADPAVAALVDEAVAESEVVGGVRVGQITADILRGGDAGSDRGVESALGNSVADFHLWATSNESFGGEPAQIAFMNPGGLRADLLYGTDGTVTFKQAADVQPFANTLVTLDLTGAQIKAVLEEQWQPEGSSRPKLHLGISEGLSYVYDPEAPRGEHVLSVSFEGEEIADDAVFRVVANSFLAAGGDNFFTFAEGTGSTDTGQIDLEATVAYFQAHDAVSPAPLGRAVVAGTDWAEVSLSAGTVEQGGSIEVTVSGLEEGQQVTAELHSDPIVVEGIPAADASGTTTFTLEVPAGFATGAHTLFVASTGLEPIATPLTVTAAAGGGSDDGDDDGSGTGSGDDDGAGAGSGSGSGSGTGTGGAGSGDGSGTGIGAGDLVNTGAQTGLFVGLALLLLTAGGVMVAARRRRQLAAEATEAP
ncbi:choice-of-anchor I family protein [Zafaria sp. Z1313]|uniref:choice-of-anchor I family protein n=1 Tax=Zafaria sp. Z1313 TaxID=3423202 RepID=UPI003D301E5F